MGRAMSSATHLFWTMRLMFLKATYWISGWDDSMVTGGKEGRGKMGGKGGGGRGGEAVILVRPCTLVVPPPALGC